MSDLLNAAREKLAEKMAGKELDGSLKFAIEGLGALRIEGEDVTVDEADADCTVTADPDTFKEMLDGDLNPTSAFMGGRLSVDGNMGMAMKLGSLLA